MTESCALRRCKTSFGLREQESPESHLCLGKQGLRPCTKPCAPLSAKTSCALSQPVRSRSADLTSVPGGLACNRSVRKSDQTFLAKFPNSGSSFAQRSNSPTRFKPRFNLPFYVILNYLLTSVSRLFNLKQTSASSGISNHGLGTTAYRPLETVTNFLFADLLLCHPDLGWGSGFLLQFSYKAKAAQKNLVNSRILPIAGADHLDPLGDRNSDHGLRPFGHKLKGSFLRG